MNSLGTTPKRARRLRIESTKSDPVESAHEAGLQYVDEKLPGLPREKVLAAIVRLLETTFVRVGNAEYAKQNHSYGLTTIRNNHVGVRGSKIHFEFRGKSGVDHDIDLEDARLAQIIRRCQELPEQELFEYIEPDGTRRDVTSTDVNEYLREISGTDFTAKHFRTWAGTVLAAIA